MRFPRQMPEMVYKEYVVQQNIVSAKLTFARICFILILTIIVSECVFLLDIARSPMSSNEYVDVCWEARLDTQNNVNIRSAWACKI